MDSGEIIKQHLVLIPNIVKKYAKMCPHLRDDFIGIALLTLTQIANDCKIENVEEQKKYICSKIHWAIRIQLAENQSIIRVPRHSSVRHFLRPIINPLLTDPKTRPNISYDLREVLGMITKSSIEKQILCLKIQGYTDREIAKKIGFSPAYIGRIKNRLEERFNELWEK